MVQNLSRANEAQGTFAGASGNEQCLSSMKATKETFLSFPNEWEDLKSRAPEGYQMPHVQSENEVSKKDRETEIKSVLDIRFFKLSLSYSRPWLAFSSVWPNTAPLLFVSCELVSLTLEI